MGNRACIERVLGRSRFIPYSTRCAGQWMCCEIYSYGCWYYSAVVLHEEDKSVLFWQNACCHLFLRKWIRGFHNLFVERPPLWFIFLGWSFICFASPVMEVFIIVLFIYFYITWCQQWHNIPKIVTCWKQCYWIYHFYSMCKGTSHVSIQELGT